MAVSASRQELIQARQQLLIAFRVRPPMSGVLRSPSSADPHADTVARDRWIAISSRVRRVEAPGGLDARPILDLKLILEIDPKREVLERLRQDDGSGPTMPTEPTARGQPLAPPRELPARGLEYYR